MTYYYTVDIEIPGWAEWIAQDKDGEWWFYKAEPVEGIYSWHAGDTRSMQESVYMGYSPKDWTQECYEIERK